MPTGLSGIIATTQYTDSKIGHFSWARPAWWARAMITGSRYVIPLVFGSFSPRWAEA